MCGKAQGTYRIIDGPVCPKCMPKELLDRSDRLKIHTLRSYYIAHRSGWTNCSVTPVTVPVGNTVSDDRSMVITTDDNVILSDEINEQLKTAEKVDIVVSFIKCSGLNLLIDGLRDFTRRGRLRVVTTAYMGVTEYEALHELFGLPNTEVRMELGTGAERLHAKAFLFERPGNGSTAYVGSANISRSALTTGEEWVVKIREKDVPEAVDDVRRSFENIWGCGSYAPVTARERGLIEAALEKNGRR